MANGIPDQVDEDSEQQASHHRAEGAVDSAEDGTRGAHGRITVPLEVALQGRPLGNPVKLYVCWGTFPVPWPRRGACGPKPPAAWVRSPT